MPNGLAMTIDVLIEGLDPKRSRALEASVRRTLLDLRAKDILRVAVLPSDADNRWDVGIRRSGGWSVTTFDSSASELSARLIGVLQSLVADGSVMA